MGYGRFTRIVKIVETVEVDYTVYGLPFTKTKKLSRRSAWSLESE